jgi:two-component system, NarL family, sensor kinase
MTTKYNLLLLLFITVNGVLFAQQNPIAVIDSLLDKTWNIRRDPANNEQVETILKDVLIRFEKHNYPKGESDAYNQLGLLYSRQKKYNESISQFEKALEIRQKTGDINGQAAVVNNLASVKRLQGEYGEAVAYVLKSIKLYEENKASIEVGRAYITLSNLYYDMRDYGDALNYLHKALPIFDKEQDSLYQAQTWFNLGILHERNESLDSAIYAQKQALALFRTLKSSNNIYQTQIALADLYIKSNDIPADIDSLISQAKQYFALTKDTKTWSDAIIIEGDLLKSRGNSNEALRAYEYAFAQGSSVMGGLDSLNVLEKIVDMLVPLQQFDRAAAFQKTIISLQKRLSEEDKLLFVQRQLAKYRTELGVKQLQEEREAERRQKRGILSLLFFTIAAIVALAYILYQRKKVVELERARNAEKYNTEITALVADSERQQKEIRQQTQKKERETLGKRIHGEIGSQMTPLRWSYETLTDKITDPQLRAQLEASNQQLDKIYHEIRGLSHEIQRGLNIMPEAEINRSLLTLRGFIKDRIEVNYYFNGLSEGLDDELGNMALHIINELVTNILKYAKAKQLTIQLSKMDSSLLLIVEDDGEGFIPEEVASNSTGLRGIQDDVNNIGGTMSIDSSPGNGTTVMIELPV